MRTLVNFKDVLKAYHNAKRKGIDLYDLLIRACASESIDENDLRLIVKFM